MGPELEHGDYDVVVVGGGPAGLQAAMLLARMQRPTLVIDSNRPRHAATLAAHAFLTRDYIPPFELRQVGRDSVTHYEHGEVAFGEVTSIEALPEDGDDVRAGYRFRVQSRSVRGSAPKDVRAKSVLLTTGISERLPDVENLRAFYGTSIHSCLACDAWDHRGKRIALFGYSGAPRLDERAVLLTQWSDDVILFADTDSVDDETAETLRNRGITVDRRHVVAAVGDQTGLTGLTIECSEGERSIVPVDAAFVRPHYEVKLGFAETLGLDVTSDGFVCVDDEGRTSVPGVYAAGEVTPPGPQMLIMAAGMGAHTAVTVNRDLLGLGPDSRRRRGEDARADVERGSVDERRRRTGESDLRMRGELP